LASVTTTEESEIHFTVEQWAPDGFLLTPFIDGRSFVSLVTEFEVGHGWEDAGIHEGMVLSRLDFEHLPRHPVQGRSPYGHPSRGTVLLGCTCGVIDCGPLYGRVLASEGQIRWLEFENPVADDLDWDYSELGPFVFDSAQFEQAITDAMAQALG
jgi:hypothetical protein